jgi:hypothetical protein
VALKSQPRTHFCGHNRAFIRCFQLGLVVYDGDFRDGKQVGHGSLLTAKKEHYAGEFEVLSPPSICTLPTPCEIQAVAQHRSHTCMLPQYGEMGGLGVMEFSHSNKYAGHWDRSQR